MPKLTLSNILKSTVGVLFTVGVHHYGSKMLDYNENKNENQIQNMRDEQLNKIDEIIEKTNKTQIEIKEKIDRIEQNMNEARSSLDNVIKKIDKNDDNVTFPIEDCNTIKNNSDNIETSCNKLQERLDNSDEVISSIYNN